MLKKISATIISIISFIAGVLIAAFIINFGYLKAKSTEFKYNNEVLFIISIALGALVPIVVNYFSIKKQEVIKLKAKVSEQDLEFIKSYKTFLSQLSVSVFGNRTKGELGFKYKFTEYDVSGTSLRESFIFKDEETYNNWIANFYVYSELAESLRNDKLNKLVWYLKSYLHNVELVRQKIAITSQWKIAFIVREDIREVNHELSNILENHIDKYIYKLKKGNHNSEENEEYQSYIDERLRKSNFYKYKYVLLESEGLS